MEANAGLVAGSHNRNELVVIRPEFDGPRSLNHVNGHICQICGDGVGITSSGELFVACNECAFPVCRPCYEYERKDGNQTCPQCKTRYKRHKGSPRVNGDDKEDDVDDLGHEFNYADINKQDQQQVTEAMLLGRMTYGRPGGRPDDDNLPSSYMIPPMTPQYPLLTNGQTVSSDAGGVVFGEQQALRLPPGTGNFLCNCCAYIIYENNRR